ncbi:hypothetical protein GCM10027088_43020 [Nocardia goodfellowii]
MRIGIDVLGPVELVIDGTAYPMDGRKLRSIAAILVARQGNTVGRDELTDALGLFETTKNSTNALHAHIARLRRWFKSHGAPADVVKTVGVAGYRLDIPRERIDALRFMDTVEHAAGLAPKTPSVVASMVEDAFGLWRGEALRDVTDSALLQSFSDDLYASKAHAQELLLTTWMTLERYDRIILTARKFIAENPLNERLWEMLIMALRRTGRDAEAIASYHRLERLLRDELGILPNPSLIRSLGTEHCA